MICYRWFQHSIVDYLQPYSFQKAIELIRRFFRRLAPFLLLFNRNPKDATLQNTLP